MVVQFKRWVAGVVLSAGLSVVWAGGPSLTAAETTEATGSNGAAASEDQERAAEKSFNDTYAKDEKAALASQDSADNITLAETLFTDSQKPTDNPALAGVMRSHAAALLFRSNDKAAYALAVELEKDALVADQAGPLATAEAMAELLAQGVKDMPAAGRPPQIAKLVGLYQALAVLQIKAHQADQAIQSLSKVASYADAANDKNAGKDASDLLDVLNPMKSNAATLSKDLAALEKALDDKNLNTDVALVLLCDWGEVTAAAQPAAKADPLQVQGLAEMAKYEAGGRLVAGLDKLAIRKLAEAYATWARDDRDSKLGHLILTMRAAELYKVLAAAAKAGSESQVAQTADQLATEAIRYEKDAAPLLAALTSGLSQSATPAGVNDSPAATESNPAMLKCKAEVQKVIDTVGPTDPDWMAAVQLNYPSSLDLTWGMPKSGGWNQSKMLGQYIWSTVNENPLQWKGGVKLMYKVMDVNKNDPAKLTQTNSALARMYFNYFKDYARAAYYWQKAGIADHLDQQHCVDNISLAHCYFQLGDTDVAKKILEGYPTDYTGHGAIINAWGVFGDVPQALKLADAAIQSGRQFIGYPAGGDVCRLAGRYDEALKYYDGYLKMKNLPAGAMKQRAQECYDTVKFFNLFDLSKVPDGTYKDSSLGFRGKVESVVTVKDHKIVDFKVNHREDQCYSSITDIPARIIEKQTVKGIDGCSGATVTSNAIILSAAKALGNSAQPRRDPKKWSGDIQ